MTHLTFSVTNCYAEFVPKVTKDNIFIAYLQTPLITRLYNVQWMIVYTGLLKMTVGILTTCHTIYTLDRSIQLHQWNKKFSKFSFMMCGVQ